MVMAEQEPNARRGQEPTLSTGMRVWLSQLEDEASVSKESNIRFLSVYATAVTEAIFIAWREEDHAAFLAQPFSSFLPELRDPIDAAIPIEVQEYETLIALTT